MEISTIIGLVLGLVSLVLGMFLKGAPLINLVNNPAKIRYYLRWYGRNHLYGVSYV